MDPNLTLAHVTHNATVILLHQHIAYPPIEWNDIFKLPSSCSAVTCQLAAVETASIAEKYLRYTDGILNSQLAFSAFVASRILLSTLRIYPSREKRFCANLTVHWQFYKTDGISQPNLSLKNISQRWHGYREDQSAHQSHDIKNLDIAARYALYLPELHTKCLRDGSFYLDILRYSKATLDNGGLLPFLSTMPVPRSFTPPKHHRTIE
jgi:hypothetical protein